MNWRAEFFQIFMAQHCLGRIKRAEDNFVFTPLQLEHFRIAKCLRQDRVTRIKITKSHSGKNES